MIQQSQEQRRIQETILRERRRLQNAKQIPESFVSIFYFLFINKFL
jgi:hypothetical protein